MGENTEKIKYQSFWGLGEQAEYNLQMDGGKNKLRIIPLKGDPVIPRKNELKQQVLRICFMVFVTYLS